MSNDIYFKELPAQFTHAELASIKEFFDNKLFLIHIAKSFHKSSALNSGRGAVTRIKFDQIALPAAIVELRSKYKFLGDECLIVDISPGSSTSIHIDSSDARSCSINFPMAGCTTESPTKFYGLYDEYPSYYSEEHYTIFLQDGIIPIEKARHTLVDIPVLLNTASWHYIKNNSAHRRIVFSWSMALGQTYDNVLKEIK